MTSIINGLQAIYNSNMREKTPLELERENRMLKQQITQLTNNWNELEEWLQNEYNEWSTVDDEIIRAEARQCIEVLDKMKEIKGENNVSSRD